MSTQLWAAFALTVALIGLLAYLVLPGPNKNLNPAQYQIMRVLTSICAAAASAFYVGEALVRIQYNGPYSILIQGIGGGAFFVLVYFFTPKLPPTTTGVEQIVMRFEAPWLFQDAAKAIVQQNDKQVLFDKNMREHLNTPISNVSINARTFPNALLQLKGGSNDLPDYKVKEEDGMFHIYI